MKVSFSLCCMNFTSAGPPGDGDRLTLEIVFRDWGGSGMRAGLHRISRTTGRATLVREARAVTWNESWNVWVDAAISKACGETLGFRDCEGALLTRWVRDGMALFRPGGQPVAAVQAGGCYRLADGAEGDRTFARGIDLLDPLGPDATPCLRDWDDALRWLEGLGITREPIPPLPSPDR